MDIANIMAWASFSDTHPLRKTLNKHVAFEESEPGNTTRPRLIVATMNIETGKTDAFDSGKTQIGPDHILASGALPPGFAPTLARNVCWRACALMRCQEYAATAGIDVNGSGQRQFTVRQRG